MKKIVVAPDSFKGSLSSASVAESVVKGIKRIFPECEVARLQVADGGEGTAEAIVAARPGRMAEARVHDPLMRKMTASYGITNDGTAVIDLAAASGITLLSPAERDPLRTSTYGTGELVKDAVGRGCGKIIVGTGGSATNDAGAGLLMALGCRFTDIAGNDIFPVGGNLAYIHNIDTAPIPENIRHAELTVAYDVVNPFFGADGAARVYSPQKGADAEATEIMEEGMRHLAGLLKRMFGRDVRNIKGSGSAGGTAGMLHAVLGARLVAGADLVLEAARFDEAVAGADLVITGEGKIDLQTLAGKLPFRIMRRAADAGVPTVAVAGRVECVPELLEAGFAYILSITPPDGKISLNPELTAMNIENAIAQVMSSLREHLR